MPTVDGEMNPTAVVAGLFSGLFVEHHHRALVPTFVVRPQVADLDRRRLDEPDATLTTVADVSSSSSSWKLDKAPVNYAHWRKQR